MVFSLHKLTAWFGLATGCGPLWGIYLEACR